MVENGRNHSSRFGSQDYSTGSSSTASAPGPRGPSGSSAHETQPTGPDAAKRALEQLGELREYVGYLVSAKLDSMKLSLRRMLIFAALGVVAGIAGMVAICLAVTQVLYGIGDGLGLLFGEHYWAGHLLTGALVLSTIGITIVVMMRKITAASRESTLRKYEARKAHQKVQFGRDVQAAAHADPNT